MKTLYILRHAKSSWDDANLLDRERPLNARGLKAAPFMGNLMRERIFVPDVIISSPAVRARQTAELVRDALDLVFAIEFDPNIYEATAPTLVSVVADIADKVRCPLIVGHNPGAESLIFYLTGQTAAMPTAALAVLELDLANWREVGGNCGKLKEIIRPRDET